MNSPMDRFRKDPTFRTVVFQLYYLLEKADITPQRFVKQQW